MTAADIARVREAPIELVLEARRVRRVGRRYLCPIHDDHHPSASVHHGRLRCWSCGWHGSSIDLVMALDHCDLRGAVQTVAAIHGITITEQTPAQRRTYARQRAADERDERDAWWWTMAAERLAEHILEDMAATDPERGDMTAVLRACSVSPASEYRVWRDRWPDLSAAMLEAGRRLDEGRQWMLARYLRQEAHGPRA